MSILDRSDLAASAELLAKACEASRDHSALTAKALATYGDHGPQISGVIRNHFPEEIKTELRKLAKEITYLSDLAFHYKKPKRVRFATMRKLSQAIAKRDGSGFYGPQA